MAATVLFQVDVAPNFASDCGRRWMASMRSGRFSAAWEIADIVLEQRRKKSCASLPRHLQWSWNGESPRGKSVLLQCYHGLGDTLQFIRYLPRLRERARKVTVWAQPALIPLLQTMADPRDELVALDDGAPPRGYEVRVEVMELPHLFRTTLETIPAEVPYFQVAGLELPRNGKPNVGLVWEAGDWDERRSIGWDLVQEFAADLTVNWHILQRGPGYAAWNRSFGIDSGSDDILTLARVIAGLDLLITVDSMPAHLAGALGVSTWILLPKPADWRWLEGRTDSPWYPSVRLFRQTRAGEWRPVLEEVKQRLRTRARVDQGISAQP